MRRHDGRDRRSPKSFIVIRVAVLDERICAGRGGRLNDERII